MGFYKNNNLNGNTCHVMNAHWHCCFDYMADIFLNLSSFPYIQQRMGKLEVQDVEMFCMAGVDFYHQVFI